jgi:hypothetical protein
MGNVGQSKWFFMVISVFLLIGAPGYVMGSDKKDEAECEWITRPDQLYKDVEIFPDSEPTGQRLSDFNDQTQQQTQPAPQLSVLTTDNKLVVLVQQQPARTFEHNNTAFPQTDITPRVPVTISNPKRPKEYSTRRHFVEIARRPPSIVTIPCRRPNVFEKCCRGLRQIFCCSSHHCDPDSDPDSDPESDPGSDLDDE